jgi:hypothetical protein
MIKLIGISFSLKVFSYVIMLSLQLKMSELGLTQRAGFTFIAHSLVAVVRKQGQIQ